MIRPYNDSSSDNSSQFRHTSMADFDSERHEAKNINLCL